MKPEEPSKASLDECRKRADGLLNRGKAFEYILAVWRNQTKGPKDIGETFLLSKGCQSVSNSKGLHVQLNGAPGYSKSFLTMAMLKLMPKVCKWDSDLSDRALFYLPDSVKDGTIMFVDDVKWSDTLGDSVKKCITHYQDGATATIVKEFKGRILHSRKRLAFWLTSVDNQPDDQIRDRIFSKEVESGTEAANRIISQMKRLDRKEPGLNNENHILTCQCIFEDISKLFVDVIIPFGDDQIIFKGGPRAYGVFSDIVKSVAIYNYRLREKVDDSIIATKEDVEIGAKIYNSMGGHDPNKFTETEQIVIDAIIDLGDHAYTSQIIEKTGLTGGRVSQIIHGRGKDQQQKNGLIDKCGLSYRRATYGNIYDLDRTSLGTQFSKVSLAWVKEEYIPAGFTPYFTRKPEKSIA